MKNHERRWTRTEDGGWVTLPCGPPGRVIVRPDGKVFADGMFGPELNISAARYWSLRLAEAAVLVETLDPDPAPPWPKPERGVAG